MLKNVKLGVKMIGGFLIVALIIVVVGVVSWIGATQLNDAIDDIGNVRLPGIEALLETEIAIEEFLVAQRTLMSERLDRRARAAQLAEFEQSRAALYEHLERYRSLPLTAAEARLLAEFDAILVTWRGFNGEWLALSAEFDAMDILDPADLIANFQQFRGDHYQAEVRTANMLLLGEMFQGGDDATACNFGRWLGTFSTENDNLALLLGRMVRPHNQFHEAIGRARAAVVSGNTAEATRIFSEDMQQASRDLFDLFYQLIDVAETANAMRDRMTALTMGPIAAEARRGGAVLDQLIHLNEEIADTAVADANTLSTTVIMLIVVALIVGVAVAIILGVILTRAITRPVSQGVEFAKRIALGELDIELSIDQRDEIGVLAGALRDMLKSLQYKAHLVDQVAQGDLTIDVEVASEKDGLGKSLVMMVDSLNDVLGQVQTAVEQVAAGAGQVSSSSQDLSQGATESASSLEEISSSINEINGQSVQSANNATEASGLAKQAASDAESGQTQMGELRTAMGSISEASGDIKKVVKVIDDIAFQINLLALNANVEAARAGKYGKGFAVVAEEVRNLAVRAAEAVKETASMVDQSVSSIETGDALTERTAAQLENIVGGAVRVAQFLEEIAAATKEQSLAIEQITSGLAQVDQVTQSNTANAEESAAASEELSSQAQQLRAAIATFKLRNAGAVLPGGRTAALPAGVGIQAREQRAAGKQKALAGASRPQGGNGARTGRQAIVLDDDNESLDRF
jgi:methyl-accepting chemotaxis protein